MNYGLLLATIQLAAGGLILILGLILLRDNPRHSVNRIVALMLFFAGLGTTLGSSDFLLTQIEPKLEQHGIDLVNEFSYLWEFFFPMLLLFTLSFPTVHPAMRRVPFLRALIFVPYLGHMALVGAHALLGSTFGIPSGPDASVVWTLPRVLVQALYGFHRTLFSLVNVAYVIVSVLVLLGAYRRATRPLIREQLRVIGWGMGACAGASIVSTFLMPMMTPGAPQAARHTLLLLALVVGCGSIAVAMVRYRFLESSLLVRRAILYAFSTAIIVGLYLVVVGEVESLFRRMTRIEETPVFRGLLLVISLILYQPLLAKMEEILENVLLRERTDYRRALQDLTSRIVTRLDSTNLGQDVVDGLHDCLLADRVALLRFTGPDARPEVWASRHSESLAGILTGQLPRPDDIRNMEMLSPFVVESDRLYAVPLRHQDEVLGALLLGSKLTGRRYSGEDVTLLSLVANQVSVAFKNAELYAATLRQVEMERDLETARSIQQAFLPTRFPQRGDIDIFAQNLPSREVGGDYYDVLEQGPDAVLLAVADVSGKGVPAALLASMLQASLRTQAGDEAGVGRMMSRLNELVCDSTSSERFATFFLGRVDLTRMRLTYANAGHNFPILLRADGRTAFLDHSDLVLGFLPEVEYGEVSVDLGVGDRLVLFTDGISEARVATRSPDGSDILGEERLLEMLRSIDGGHSACDVVREVQRRLAAMVRTDDEADDMTLVVMHLRETAAISPQAVSDH